MLIPFSTLTKKYRFQPQGVLHIGASTGQEAQAYQDLGVHRVVWIEADPVVFQGLERHLKNFPNQEAIVACISDTTGDWVNFNVANNGGQSSSLLEFGTHSTVHPEVRFNDRLRLMTFRIDDLPIAFTGLDFLNIDIQGAEMLALKGMGEILDQFNYAYLEVNCAKLYIGCPLMREVQGFMKSKGFQFKEAKECGNTKWGDAFWMR